MNTHIRRMCRHTLFVLLVLALSAVLFACAKPQQGPPLPEVNIGIAGFEQPKTPLDMLAGYAPENSPEIPRKVMTQLDETLINVLTLGTSRTYVTGERYLQCRNAKAPGQTRSRVAALHHWSAVGMCMKVDVLLVPHLFKFQEREGSEAGITRPAGVTMDIFLIDVKNKQLVSRSHFDETQQALADNLLNSGKFFSRGAKWLTGVQLAREGMGKAIKDLGL